MSYIVSEGYEAFIAASDLRRVDEQEDPQYVFRDRTDRERFNFMKCIWTRPAP